MCWLGARFTGNPSAKTCLLFGAPPRGGDLKVWECTQIEHNLCYIRIYFIRDQKKISESWPRRKICSKIKYPMIFWSDDLDLLSAPVEMIRELYFLSISNPLAFFVKPWYEICAQFYLVNFIRRKIKWKNSIFIQNYAKPYER